MERRSNQLTRKIATEEMDQVSGGAFGFAVLPEALGGFGFGRRGAGRTPGADGADGVPGQPGDPCFDFRNI